MDVMVKKKDGKTTKTQPEARIVSDEEYDAILAEVMKKHRKSLEILAKH